MSRALAQKFAAPIAERTLIDDAPVSDLRFRVLLGDRRDYYEAEADMLEMIRRIAMGRKARELDPALATLRECVAEAERDRTVSPTAKARFKQMLDVMEGVDRSFAEVMRLPSPVLSRLIRMGGAVARLVSPGRKKG